MSHGVKLTLFLLAFNIIGFAEGYLLHELGLQWLVPIIPSNGVWSGAAESVVV
jgi:predicted branched-subunit amino acid permease